jgi:DNA-binding winged helix-turn-helix (wHTH) protein/predicted ATPase
MQAAATNVVKRFRKCSKIFSKMADSYAFGPFRLDISAEILFRGDEPLPVGRRAVSLLRTLIEHAGVPVSKDALIEAAWPGLAVEESNLSVQIAALRKVLGGEPGADKWIETLPRRGYRFVGEVEDAGRPVEPTPSAEAAPAANKSAAAERRQLTVASCEFLLGARGGMDPEDLREIVGSYHGCLLDTARRYDAFVAYTHGNMASLFFGYPHAREDDAERAVHAALSLIAAVASLKSPIPLHARTGIATGLVVVGAPVSLGGPPDVAGETPNIAPRLHAIAAPDEVVISESTRRLLGALFELRDLGMQNLEGVAEGGHAFKVVGPSSAGSRFEALHTDGLTTLVGREEELELLLRRWSRAKAGQGQVVLLSGEAGIGKSRLAAALLEAIASEPHTRLRYFCSPQHIDSAFYPIIRHFERVAGFARDDVPQIKVDKLDALFALVSISKQDAPLIAELLSVPNDGRYPTFGPLAPQQWRQRTLDALTAQMEALSRRNPLLIIFEDVHWSDPTSLEACSRAVERLKSLRILMLVTFRPEFHAPWVGRPYVTSLTINRLSEREADAMIDHVVGDKSLPSPVRRDINARTDGIPLFVEEMTKAVLEAESEAEARRTIAAIAAPALAVPASLHASLMARLDRLGPAKEVAQIGAAIGREFSHALLAAVVRKPEGELGSALDRLAQAGLLFRQGVSPHATYLFKHALVQDAAYGTLLREPRRALHARIADTLESQFAGIAESRPELLARHFTEAGLIEKAADLWGKAGQRSLERSALVEAAEQLTRALDQIAALPATPALRREQIKLQVALITPLMHVKGFAAPETKAAAERAHLLIEQAEALGERPEDPLLLFSVLYAFWVANYVAYSGDVIRNLAAQFLTLAEKQGAIVPRMIGHRLTAISLASTGDIAEGRAHYDQALALYDPAQHRPLAMRFGQDAGVTILCHRSWALFCLGYPEAALADAENAFKDACEIGHAATLMHALAYGSFIQIQCGNYPKATARLQELFALANEKGALYWKALGMMLEGCALALTSKASDAVHMITSGINAWRSTRATLHESLFLSHLARAYAELGQFDHAWRCIGEAMTAVETTKERWCEANIHRIAGEIALMPPEPDATKVEAYFERALAVARAQQAKSWELRAAINMARLWRDQGKRDEARDLLTPVYNWFTEGFDTLDLKEAKALLGELAS